MTGKQLAITKHAIDLMKERDPNEVTILAIHRVVAKGGRDLDAIQAFALEYNCELDIFEKERILVKDVFIQVMGKTADLILFYIAYSNCFGEPEDIS